MSYKAFVSSTFLDLEEHRARAIDALRNAGIHVDPMENWTADSHVPKVLSVERMRGCDLCILLVGARRGHVPEDEVLSIPQMEVQEADKRGIDLLCFLYAGESPWPTAYYELNDDEELKRWRADLLEHRCAGKFTCDPGSLDAPVRDAISRWLQKQRWPEVLKTYLETIRDAHASVRLLGVGHYKDIQDRSIEDLFVDPRVSSQRISADAPPEKWPETTPVLELVSAEKRLVLLGDPGCGKSTLVSWVAWNLAREGENKWKKALNERTPIVMVLREMSLDRVRSWDVQSPRSIRDPCERGHEAFHQGHSRQPLHAPPGPDSQSPDDDGVDPSSACQAPPPPRPALHRHRERLPAVDRRTPPHLAPRLLASGPEAVAGPYRLRDAAAPPPGLRRKR